MKNIILVMLKVFLISAAVILAVLMVFALVFMMDWPWWVGLFLILFIIGLLIGALFLRKLMSRRKEQQFVQQVIEQDESQMKKLQQAELNEQKELQNRWKEAVETLRRSHLKKQGNPLYALPWYLVMGESGSGKTTSISSAHLSSPFIEVKRASGISGTRNCDWWFFEQAIIIDTAGRYAIPVDEGKDKDEWQKFLTLLVKYRKREPIHGLIVTVAADKLLTAPVEELEEDGRQIRRRVDELMRVLGIKFPIYLLVTKCDLVQGMTRFSDRLPEKSLDQPMGAVNQEMSKDVAGFLDRAMAAIGERLRNLRLLLLHQPEPLDTAFLIYPEEFENLKKGLDPFIKAAFQENPYQDTPILRGLYFSSGRQEGTPYSHFLNALGLIGDNDVLPGTSKGLFLHDFFSKILPRDRGLFAPTKRSIEWQTVTRNLGLTSWILVGLALCGLLSYGFVKDLSTIRKASHFSRSPEFRGDFISDSVTMERYRSLILDVEADNRSWWPPRFGLNESRKVEIELKKRYCKLFQDRFLLAFDRKMRDDISGLSPSTPEEITGQYIVHLVRRINLLKTCLDKSGLSALQSKPLPMYVINGSPQSTDMENRKLFGNLYLSYLLWRSDSDEIEREISELQALLMRAHTVTRANFHWLVNWVNRDASISPITLQSFWGGSLSLPDEQPISAAFTRKGKESVESFLGEMNASYPDQSAFEKDRSTFETWYRNGIFSAWQNFAIMFPRGYQRLKGAREWQQTAAAMSTDRGPYFAFLNRVTSELEPLIGAEGMPAWLSQACRYQLLKSKGTNAEIVTKTAEQGKSILVKLDKLFGRNSEGAAALNSQMAAAKAIQDYQSALSAITLASQSRNQTYQLALQVFSEDQASGQSPFYNAAAAASRFKAGTDDGNGDGTFWALFNGPLNFLWAYARTEAGCSIQQQWEEKVLQEVQGAPDQQATQYLLSQDGPVWKFVKGPAAPFLGWSAQRGYYSRVALDGSVPFEPVFFSFLTKGARVRVAAPVQKQNFNVTIRGLPTDANNDAGIKPQSTRLEMQSASGSQVLENLNFPVTRTFSWTPDSGGDVILRIEVGNIVLTKRYEGVQGFPDFLRSFRGGRHTFTPGDFPRQKSSLERMGIKYIRVNYQFSGDLSLTGNAAQPSLPGQAPRTIVHCWD